MSSNRFPKSSRLLKKRDFTFRHFRRIQTPCFHFLYTTEGQGRLGVSISKKVLRRAVARNRVRRLLKESFRLHHVEYGGMDLHVVGVSGLKEAWRELTRQDVEAILSEAFRNKPGMGRANPCAD